MAAAANTVYNNYFLSNEVEDQLNSHLDLMQFCTVDRTLEETAGMTRKFNVYSATNGTEKVAVGQGNSKSITVSYEPKSYKVLMAQNRFDWNDEQAMEDPEIVPVGMKHAGTDMFNTMNADIYAEFAKTGLEVPATAPDFDAFVDAQVALNIEDVEGVQTFAICSPEDKGKIRKALKDDLKYVEAFARTGYIGTVAGTNIYTKKDAKKGEIIVATKEAVRLFIKKGVEVEVISKGSRSEEAANTRSNSAFTRKCYVPVLYNESKAVKIVLG